MYLSFKNEGDTRYATAMSSVRKDGRMVKG